MRAFEGAKFFFLSEIPKIKSTTSSFFLLAFSSLFSSLPQNHTPCAQRPSRRPGAAQRPSLLLRARASLPSPLSQPSRPRPPTSAASPTRRSTRPSPNRSARCSTCASRRRPDRFVDDGFTRLVAARKDQKKMRKARFGRAASCAVRCHFSFDVLGDGKNSILSEPLRRAISLRSPPRWSRWHQCWSLVARKSKDKRGRGCISETNDADAPTLPFFLQPPLARSLALPFFFDLDLDPDLSLLLFFLPPPAPLLLTAPSSPPQ